MKRAGFSKHYQRSEAILVLSRTVNEKIIITSPDGTRITLMVVEIRGNKMRLGVDCPRAWLVHRAEIQDRVDSEKP